MDRYRRPISPSQHLPELFGTQFLRFLPGFEASGPSETRVASPDEEGWDGRAIQMYSVQLPSFTSATSTAASEVAQGGATGVAPLRQGLSTDTLASSMAPASTRAITAIRTARILGAPVVYYALLLGSLGLCAFSYSYVTKTMLDRSQKGGMGAALPATSAGPGSLLSVPVPHSPPTYGNFTRGNEEPRNDVAVSGHHRRHGRRHRKKNKSPKLPHRSARPAGHHHNHHRRTSVDAASTSPSAPARRLVPEAEEVTSGGAGPTTAATSSSPPPPPTVTRGATPENGMLLNSSANPDLYEEVFEYYYVYDDNGTLSSSAPLQKKPTNYVLPIN